MLSAIDSITIVKSGPKTGEASIKLSLGEAEFLNINKVIIDLNDGSSPITL